MPRCRAELTSDVKWTTGHVFYAHDRRVVNVFRFPLKIFLVGPFRLATGENDRQEIGRGVRFANGQQNVNAAR